MKNRFTKYLDKDSVIILEGRTKKEILDELINAAAQKSGIDVSLIRELTWKREKMMTTGVGGGLALPHVRLESLNFPIIFCGVCAEPVSDYGTQDNEPVKVALYLMAPTGNQDSYLELLGSISAKLRTPGIIEEIYDNVTRPSQIMRILKRRANNGEGDCDDNEEGEE